MLETTKPHNDKDDDNHNMSKRLEQENTDLIPGEYEGCAKVWECSLDLCHYLTAQLLDDTFQTTTTNTYDTTYTTNDDNDNILKRIMSCASSTGIKIWEMGCGHALPACLLYRYALQHSIPIKQVLLSDYNDFVLRQLTCPNIILNTPQQQHQQQQNNNNNDNNVVLFASGDWMDLSASLSSSQKSSSLFHHDDNNKNTKHPNYNNEKNNHDKFDLILAAETTYTPQAAQETAILLSRHLTPNTGMALVASKRFYFGVGGGTDAFIAAAHSIPGLTVTRIQEYDSGMANIRDLLRIIYYKNPSPT